MIFPLHNEEAHLLGRRERADFDALEGKRVAIGSDEALSRSKGGDIDAMFYVAGFPVTLFLWDASDEDSLALIPITNKSIVEFFL